MSTSLPLISFGKLGEGMPMPHLLDIQTQAFKALLKPVGEDHQPDVGLDRVFRDLFPISDVNENYLLEFVSYARRPVISATSLSAGSPRGML